MKYNLLISAGLCLCLCACNDDHDGNVGDSDTTQTSMQYPAAFKSDHTDDYFGTTVKDPYRWMENENGDTLRQWIDEENDVFERYMQRIPYRKQIEERLTEVWNYPKKSAPIRGGESNQYFMYQNTGLQNQDVLYKMKGLDGEPVVILDPNKFSDDGTVALSNMTVSRNGNFLGYGTAKSGSDWNEFYVMDVRNGQKMEDHLQWVKFSGISWKGDGFYYSRYEIPDSAKRYSSKNQYHQVWYHKVGTAQSEDRLVYKDNEHPDRSHYAQTTEDERFLVIYTSESASGTNGLLVKDLSKPSSPILHVVDSFTNEYSVIGNMEGKLVVQTDKDAPHYKLVLIDPQHPEDQNWEALVPEREEVLQSASLAGSKILTEYMKDASSRLYVFDKKGQNMQEVQLPTLGSVGGFGGRQSDSVVFYTFTSFSYPTTIYKYNIAKNESTVYRKSEVKFNPDEYTTEQVFYNSKDGTRIPMFITYKKGMKKDGSNPTLLYGYGGFNISITPSFSTSNIVFLEQGGIYAVANIRGGGEYGAEWHLAGTKLNKQNVFDDFIAAAEYLISEKYTKKEKLAIKGRSNGGLLIGATMAQRPDLVQVALPGVGVMDMLRFHTFTIGHHWTYDYGSSEKKKEFRALYKYSPVHNLDSGTCYPATLVTTADHDDRVVPAHSFKFAAALQAAQSCGNPTLIRIDTKAGHGAGKPTAKLIEEEADVWAFTFYNLGMQPQYGGSETAQGGR